MNAERAFAVIRLARSRRVIHRDHGFEVRTRSASGAFFRYEVAVYPYRRNADGRLSPRLRAAPAYFGPGYDPGALIVEAAEWLLDTFPELDDAGQTSTDERTRISGAEDAP